MAVTTLDYVPEAGKVLIDDHKGHPGIKATTLTYGQINDDMLGMLEKPHPSYFLLLLGFLLALLLGAVSLSIQVDVGIGFSGCLLYTSPSPRDKRQSRMPSSA